MVTALEHRLDDLDAIPVSRPLVEILQKEGLIGAAVAASLVAGDGAKPPHPSTVMRWHRTGVRSPDGRVIRLEAVVLGGRLKTSRAAVLRFLAGQQPAPDAERPTLRTPTARRQASEAAEQELILAGC